MLSKKFLKLFFGVCLVLPLYAKPNDRTNQANKVTTEKNQIDKTNQTAKHTTPENVQPDQSIEKDGATGASITPKNQMQRDQESVAAKRTAIREARRNWAEDKTGFLLGVDIPFTFESNATIGSMIGGGAKLGFQFFKDTPFVGSRTVLSYSYVAAQSKNNPSANLFSQDILLSCDALFDIPFNFSSPNYGIGFIVGLIPLGFEQYYDDTSFRYALGGRLGLGAVIATNHRLELIFQALFKPSVMVDNLSRKTRATVSGWFSDNESQVNYHNSNNFSLNISYSYVF